MGRRKRIGLFVGYPEIVHVRRITEGAMEQCKKYDYDLCVFASSIHLSFPHENYVKGEANIFRLANLAELDGVILDHTTLTGDPDDRSLKMLVKRLEQYPELPKFSLELPTEGTELIHNDNEAVLREMVRHTIEDHGRKKSISYKGKRQGFYSPCLFILLLKFIISQLRSYRRISHCLHHRLHQVLP